MGQEFFTLFQLETKRLLWLIGITFAVIVAFQYLEFPYGTVLLSQFSAEKITTSGSSIFHATDLSPESKLEMANKTRMSRENDTITKTGFVLEQDSPPKKSLGNVSKTQQAGGDVGAGSYNKTMSLSFSTYGSQEENITSRPENKSGSPYAYSPSPSLEKATTYFTPPSSPTTNVRSYNTTAVLSNDHSMTLSQENNRTNSMKEGRTRPLHSDGNVKAQNSTINIAPKVKQDSFTPIPEVTSVSEMNKLLLQSHASNRSMRPMWFSAVDQELQHARSEIENAANLKNDPNLYAPIYQNVSMFKRSYELMEETLKVYIYAEGDRPIMHSPVFTGLYASEGWFMKQMEANKRFATRDPNKAHLFYLPFSSRMLRQKLYVPGTYFNNMIQYLHGYVDMIAGKYFFWNRTGGADHFLVGCHDWTPAETKVYMANCIRALCNADVKEGFVFGKDVSLPETKVRNPVNPIKDLGGNSASKRTTLAFFAGGVHGDVRPILWQHWLNKDPDMKIFGRLPKSKGNWNYIQYMKTSKYCICAKGYEVNSPRVVEAIFYECVPVIISDNFVPPFFEVLNWESFAVFVLEKDIPNLKNILLSIPEKTYLRLQMRVKKVQQHFLWHKNPVKYDIFHMILHSIWYNRVFSIVTR